LVVIAAPRAKRVSEESQSLTRRHDSGKGVGSGRKYSKQKKRVMEKREKKGVHEKPLPPTEGEKEINDHGAEAEGEKNE